MDILKKENNQQYVQFKYIIEVTKILQLDVNDNETIAVITVGMYN